MPSRDDYLKRAGYIALAGNAILAVCKLVVGLISNSLAVVGDGVDTSADVLIAFVALVAIRIVSKPGDLNHPYGHTRAETTATALVSFVLFFAGAQLIIRSISSIITTTEYQMPGTIALMVTAVSIVGKLLLAWSQARYAKLTRSSLLEANSKNMRADVAISVSVLVGLAAVFIFKMPIIDRILAMAVGLWVIKVAVGIFLETNTELMDGTIGKGPYEEIFKAVEGVAGVHNPHRTRVRKLGSILLVDLDIEVSPNLKVSEAHEIAVQVEQSIKDILPDVYDVVVHVEPDGHDWTQERYGVRPSDNK